MLATDMSCSIFKNLNARLWPTVLIFGLGACGYQGAEERSTLKAEEQTYALWCESWDINCEASPVTGGSTPVFSAEKWDALTSIANEALAGSVRFSVTRAEVDSPQLTQALTKLGFVSELNQLKTTLDKSQWQSMGIENKSVVSRSLTEGSLVASNGLTMNAGTALSLSLGQGGVIQVDGLSLASKSGDKSSAMSHVAVGGGDFLDLNFSDQVVKNVPFKFIEDSLASSFGYETATEPVELSPAQVIGAAYPLLSWINKPERTATLSRKFFALAETKLQPVLAGEDFGPALLTLVSALNSFEFSATAGKNVAHFAQVAGAKLVCNMNDGEAKVMLDKEFGLKRFYAVDGGVGLEFYGVKATARLALGIPLTLKRVELREDKITILDIPLIGKVDVDLDQLTEESGEESTFACDK